MGTFEIMGPSDELLTLKITMCLIVLNRFTFVHVWWFDGGHQSNWPAAFNHEFFTVLNTIHFNWLLK